MKSCVNKAQGLGGRGAWTCSTEVVVRSCRFFAFTIDPLQEQELCATELFRESAGAFHCIYLEEFEFSAELVAAVHKCEILEIGRALCSNIKTNFKRIHKPNSFIQEGSLYSS